MTPFTGEPLLAIIAHLDAELAATGRAVIRVLDPAHGRGRYAGERVELDGVAYVHRPLRAWLELADRKRLRVIVSALAPPCIELTFERLAPAAPDDAVPVTEKHGAGSERQRISKLEDPGFVLDLVDALDRVALAPGATVLSLGVNTGDELALIEHVVPGLAITGIDHSASALAIARNRFPHGRFFEADLHALPALGLGRFDLVVSVATLQSAGLDDREVLRRIVQDHLAPSGAVILGIPNCRYRDGEVSPGARMKNFRQAELGLLIKDVAFYRKYLQQHHRQVFVTGTHYVLVTGVASRSGQ